MNSQKTPQQLFDLSGRVAIITGGGGLLGGRHAGSLAAAGATPILVDITLERATKRAAQLKEDFGVEALAFQADITDQEALQQLRDTILERFGRIDILINNAANNPKVEDASATGWERFESFSLSQWDADMNVGLKGAFLCCQVFGSEMASRRSGSIINIASIFGVIAPDQRLYRQEGLSDEEQPVKPVTYSVVKTGILGLTTYLAAYWGEKGVRVNAISPGGIENGQPADAVRRMGEAAPLGRMGNIDDLEGAILYLSSDVSSYVTGLNMIVDGGRFIW